MTGRTLRLPSTTPGARILGMGSSQPDNVVTEQVQRAGSAGWRQT